MNKNNELSIRIFLTQINILVLTYYFTFLKILVK